MQNKTTKTGKGFIRVFRNLGMVLLVLAILSVPFYFTGCSGDSGGGGEADPQISYIEVTPDNESIPVGTTQQFRATAVLTDNTTEDITDEVSWESSNTQVATVDEGGLATASDGYPGTITITATLTLNEVTGKTLTDSVTLTVKNVTLQSISVTNDDGQANPSIPNGLTEQFKAVGTYDDGSTKDITDSVTWSSGNTGVATISNLPQSEGLATSVAVGTTTITATGTATTSKTTVSGYTQLTVTAAELAEIQVTDENGLSNPSIPNGLPLQFVATGIFTDNTTQDITDQVTWASGNTNVATIDNTGLASTLDDGTSVISATLNGISGSTVLTVTEATLTEIQVTPPVPTVHLGLTQQFIATGIYSDGNNYDITSAVTWASSDEAVATISNVAGSKGLAQAVGTGTTTITAVLGEISDDVTLTVDDAVLTAIDVTPKNPTVPVNETQQFTATGTYSDGTTFDITQYVTWASSDQNVATISNANGSKGLATVLSMGTTNITASYVNISGDTITSDPVELNATNAWTLLVYIAADNDLADYGLAAIKDLESVGSGTSVNIIVQYDKGTNTVNNVNWDGCKRFYITKDESGSSSITSTELDDLGDIDSGDVAEFENFVTWGMTNYPAEKYGILVWNHGSGWKSLSIRPTGICYDYDTGNHITENQFRTAFNNIYTFNGNEKVEFVFLSACLMGMAEISYDLSPYANYLTASTDLGWVGIPSPTYFNFVQAMVDDPTIKGDDLGNEVVQAYQNWCESVGINQATMAVIDLSKMNTLSQHCLDFVNRLNEDPDLDGNTIMDDELAVLTAGVNAAEDYETGQDYRDLYGFADYIANNAGDADLVTYAGNIRDTIANDLVLYNYAGSSHTGANGISIWLINDYSSYDTNYEDLLFDDDTGWGSNFLVNFPDI